MRSVRQRRPTGNRAGFTLIEVVVAALLLAVGIVGSLQALTAMARGGAQANEHEELQRLAIAKYDELLATGQFDGTSAQGDFSDWGDTTHSWSSTDAQTSLTNVEVLAVTVTRTDQPDGQQGVVSGLYYRPSTSTTSSTSGQARGGVAR